MFDPHIVIIGGGPSGSAAAIRAIQSGLRVVIIERESFPRDHPGEMLHPGVEPLLEQLGVKAEVMSAGFLRHEGHWVEWGDAPRFLTYGRDRRGAWKALQVWRASFDSILMDRARSLGASVIQPCRVLRARVEGNRVVGVETDRGSFRAPYVIDAAGSRHWLAANLKLRVEKITPPVVVWYGYVKGRCPRRDGAPALIADDEGWTWTARVSQDTYHWSRLYFDHRRIKPDWVPGEFEGLSPCGMTRGADVTWRAVTDPAGPGYFMAGDAAAVLDPVSSHGVLRAIMSGIMASHAIKKVLIDGAPAEQVSADYCRWILDWFFGDVKSIQALYEQLRTSQGWQVKVRHQHI